MSHIMNLTAYDTHKHKWLCLRGEKHIRRFPFWRPFCFSCLVPAVCYWSWVAGDCCRIKQSYNPIWQVWGFS
uniref:Uncharacterized protein n=1 Tax=Nomascus leucogenys TaxID=61853 RepID=A0A2I3G636_NOMLE